MSASEKLRILKERSAVYNIGYELIAVLPEIIVCIEALEQADDFQRDIDPKAALAALDAKLVGE